MKVTALTKNKAKIEVESYGMVRRAKLYYLRDLQGKKAKIKETLKANREKFLADHKELFVEIRQQLADLKKDLKNHTKPIDAGGGEGGGRRKGQN